MVYSHAHRGRCRKVSQKWTRTNEEGRAGEENVEASTILSPFTGTRGTRGHHAATRRKRRSNAVLVITSREVAGVTKFPANGPASGSREDDPLLL